MSVPFGKVLGAIIYAQRQARGLSQQELATTARMHPMAISKVERGVHKDLCIGTLRQVAEGLSSGGVTTSSGHILDLAETWDAEIKDRERRGETFDECTNGARLAARLLLVKWSE